MKNIVWSFLLWILSSGNLSGEEEEERGILFRKME
jgi:hypothetical protein